jgi:hypothetical protein
MAREWWTAELNGSELHLLTKDVPPLRAVRTSSHYGLASSYLPSGGQALLLHVLELPAPPKK